MSKFLNESSRLSAGFIDFGLCYALSSLYTQSQFFTLSFLCANLVEDIVQIRIEIPKIKIHSYGLCQCL